MASQPIATIAPAEAIDPSTSLGTGFEPESLIPLAAGVAYAAPAAFLAWLARAKPGQVCLYARATMLSRREPIGATVRLVSDGGQVGLWQARPHALFPFNYFARRTEKVLIPQRPLSPDGQRALLTETQARLLDHLTELAEAGQPHGSNSGIAMRLGLGSREAVAGALTALERRGLIRRGQDAVFARVIEIVETGCKTRGCR